MLSLILDRSDSNAPNQASCFTKTVIELKKRTLIDSGNTAPKDTFTIDSPIPYDIQQLQKKLHADDIKMQEGAKGKEVKGPLNGKLSNFISRLETKLQDRRYAFMFQPLQDAMDYNWLAKELADKLLSTENNSGIKIIDFSEVPRKSHTDSFYL